MHDIFVKDLVEKANASLIQGNLDDILQNFSIDTRTLQTNDVFVGIKGENFDGNNLYQEAILNGAKGCILDNDTSLDNQFLKKYSNVFIVTCKNTIDAIQDLASYKRSLYDIPVIGITGSVGKTSTKDMIASVMEKKYHVLKTIGNFNSHIGLPLTILSLKDHDAAVLEMGMNGLGEISLLSKIAKPTCAVITNVGTAHIGLLGSRENILKAKLEIIDGLTSDGTLIINNDNDLLNEWNKNNHEKINIISYAINNNANFMASNISFNETFSTFELEDTTFRVNVPGEHFVLNALCAISVGHVFDIPINLIQEGIENFSLTKRRMEIEKKGNITIINDAYNANLDSMKAALEYLGRLKNRKIAVLGDMLELGDYSEDIHRNIGKIIRDNNIDITILVGNECKYTYDELNGKKEVYHFMNNNDAIKKIKELIQEGDVILLKASNGMHFNEINEALIRS